MAGLGAALLFFLPAAAGTQGAVCQPEWLLRWGYGWVNWWYWAHHEKVRDHPGAVALGPLAWAM